MKTYIRKMIKNDLADQQIFEYIIEISAKIPFRFFNSTTRKITTKIIHTLPLPNGIVPLFKTINKINHTLIPINSRKLATPIIPKTLVPII